MAVERERKFIVNQRLLPLAARCNGRYVQSGYFTEAGQPAIRVTVANDGMDKPRYKLCIKSPGGYERQEFEYDIPRDDALALLELAPTKLERIRYFYQGWEIDMVPTQFAALPLWYAEWEDSAKGGQPVPSPLPAWIMCEATNMPVHSMQALHWALGRKEVSK